MKNCSQSMTLLGTVEYVEPANLQFGLRLRSGDMLDAYASAEIQCGVLTNLDGLDQDRVPEPAQGNLDSDASRAVAKYIRPGDRIYVQGMMLERDNGKRFEVGKVTLLHYKPGGFLFETATHWWLTQIKTMADEWLQDLFGDSRDYESSDFSRLYRTSLNIYGGSTDDTIQVMATLSRLIYGLSSAYSLLGDERFLRAAGAGVEFQRQAFRSLSHDGHTIVWNHARRRLVNGSVTLIASENPDDRGSIPLYEQIYALAGMAQYFRITGDSAVLGDIERTVSTFNSFYLDEKSVDPGFGGFGGYFSHIDPATMRPDVAALGHNRSRKNWNSIGDHIPAYLVNVILALDPLPSGAGKSVARFLAVCKEMLDRTTNLIIEKFPDPECAFVNERFFADWKPDHEWGWQRNRAIVGHNLKIAWNLTRVAAYYLSQGRENDAARCMGVAEKLGKTMVDAGLDVNRGGCYDAVERKPGNGQAIEFVWGDHKDFWQQEQAILAYLILFGHTGEQLYLDLARDCTAWWNTFQVSRENRCAIFRVNDNGDPMVQCRGMAEYDIAGYHSFELNVLAHIYTRAYVDRGDQGESELCLYFRPGPTYAFESMNVLPDFIKPGTLEIAGIEVDGQERAYVAHDDFQVPVDPKERGREFVVRFRSLRRQERPKS